MRLHGPHVLAGTCMCCQASGSHAGMVRHTNLRKAHQPMRIWICCPSLETRVRVRATMACASRATCAVQASAVQALQVSGTDSTSICCTGSTCEQHRGKAGSTGPRACAAVPEERSTPVSTGHAAHLDSCCSGVFSLGARNRHERIPDGLHLVALKLVHLQPQCTQVTRQANE